MAHPVKRADSPRFRLWLGVAAALASLPLCWLLYSAAEEQGLLDPTENGGPSLRYWFYKLRHARIVPKMVQPRLHSTGYVGDEILDEGASDQIAAFGSRAVPSLLDMLAEDPPMDKLAEHTLKKMSALIAVGPLFDAIADPSAKPSQKLKACQILLHFLLRAKQADRDGTAFHAVASATAAGRAVSNPAPDQALFWTYANHAESLSKQMDGIPVDFDRTPQHLLAEMMPLAGIPSGPSHSLSIAPPPGERVPKAQNSSAAPAPGPVGILEISESEDKLVIMAKLERLNNSALQDEDLYGPVGRCLKHSDGWVRSKAASIVLKRAVKNPDGWSEPLLFIIEKGEDYQLRSTAVSLAAKLREPQLGLQACVDGFADKTSLVHWSSKAALSDWLRSHPDLAEQAAPQLVPVLRPDNCEEIAQILAALGAKSLSAVPSLTELAQGPDAERAAAAAKVLSRISPEKRASAGALLARLKDPEAANRETALKELVVFEGGAFASDTILGRAMRDRDSGVRLTAAEAHWDLHYRPGGPIVYAVNPVLDEELRSPKTDQTLRRAMALVRLQGRAGCSHVPLLVKHLDPTKPAVCLDAIATLKIVGVGRATEALPPLQRLAGEPLSKEAPSQAAQDIKAAAADAVTEIQARRFDGH